MTTLYWPEARFGLLVGRGTPTQGSEEGYPADVLLVTVRRDQVDDPVFIGEMRELIAKRTRDFAAATREGTSETDGSRSQEHQPDEKFIKRGIPTVNDIFESLVAAEELEDAMQGDGEDLGEDAYLEDCLGHALEIGYGLAAGGAPQVQLVINGCRDVVVHPA